MTQWLRATAYAPVAVLQCVIPCATNWPNTQSMSLAHLRLGMSAQPALCSALETFRELTAVRGSALMPSAYACGHIRRTGAPLVPIAG